MHLIEREAVILNTAWGMIDDMVNWAVFVKNDMTEQATRWFYTAEHSRLFVVLLTDFLSPVTGAAPLGLLPHPQQSPPADRTFLFHLRRLCERPQLGAEARDLSEAVERFAAWLEVEFVAPGVYLGEIEVAVDLRVSRYTYIRMCGNIAKHSLPRLSANVKVLCALMEASGTPVKEEEAYRALGDFFTWFHDNIFAYHASEIAELLNNIRWAMFEYLGDEFRRSKYRPEGGHELEYPYHIPPDCNAPVARGMYWDLMNRVRRKPLMPRFTVDDALKRRYSGDLQTTTEPR